MSTICWKRMNLGRVIVRSETRKHVCEPSHGQWLPREFETPSAESVRTVDRSLTLRWIGFICLAYVHVNDVHMPCMQYALVLLFSIFEVLSYCSFYHSNTMSSCGLLQIYCGPRTYTRGTRTVARGPQSEPQGHFLWTATAFCVREILNL